MPGGDSPGARRRGRRITGAEETARLHARSLAAASGLAEEIAGDLRLFLGELEKEDRAGSAYTVLFCYVQDDLVWDRFEEAGLIRARGMSAEEPFWNGAVWAITPPRAFSMGTNKISEGGVFLMVNWTEAAIPRMVPFVADWKNLSRLFDDFAREGRVVDPEARRVFPPFRFFDGEGRITAPEDVGDLVFFVRGGV